MSNEQMEAAREKWAVKSTRWDQIGAWNAGWAACESAMKGGEETTPAVAPVEPWLDSPPKVTLESLVALNDGITAYGKRMWDGGRESVGSQIGDLHQSWRQTSNDVIAEVTAERDAARAELAKLKSPTPIDPATVVVTEKDRAAADAFHSKPPTSTELDAAQGRWNEACRIQLARFIATARAEGRAEMDSQSVPYQQGWKAGQADERTRREQAEAKLAEAK